MCKRIIAMNIYKTFALASALAGVHAVAMAQDASPVVKFYSVDEAADVEVTPGESQTAQAPLDISMTANINNPNGYDYVCEWRLWSMKESEQTPMMTRFEENTDFTLSKSGGYGIKLYVTFTHDGDTIEYASDAMNVVISESKLTCPDGFSPNGDGINDYYRITAQSIVKLRATFFNRWGQAVHSVSLDDAEHADGEPNKLILWDGRNNGKYVKDGVYFLNLYGLGSDGIEYKFKKAVNVLKGFNEQSETTGGDGN